MRIFMPSVHPRRTKGFAESLAYSGHELYLPGPSMTLGCGVHRPYSTDQARKEFGLNVSSYEAEEILSAPPDVIVIGREDSQEPLFQLSDTIKAEKPCVCAFYSGNFHSDPNWAKYQAAICTDIATMKLAAVHHVPSIKFRPNFDFADFPYRPAASSNKIILRSYIQDFAARYPTAYNLHQEMVNHFNGRPSLNTTVENFERLPLERVKSLMVGSSATLHIKDQEGFGWSVIESMAIGRPLVLQRGLIKHMAMEEWAVEGQTAVYFDSLDELENILTKFMDRPEELARLQASTAEVVREIFKPTEYAKKLSTFLEEILSVEKARWSIRNNHKVKTLSWVPRHSPSMSRYAVQGFELYDEIYWKADCLSLPGALFKTVGQYTSERWATVSSAAVDSNIIVWGPYLSLQMGTYEIAFNLRVRHSQNTYVEVTATFEKKIRVLNSSLIKLDGHPEVKHCVSFKNESTIQRLEFRIVIEDSSKGVDIDLVSVEVRRK